MDCFYLGINAKFFMSLHHKCELSTLIYLYEAVFLWYSKLFINFCWEASFLHCSLKVSQNTIFDTALTFDSFCTMYFSFSVENLVQIFISITNHKINCQHTCFVQLSLKLGFSLVLLTLYLLKSKHVKCEWIIRSS